MVELKTANVASSDIKDRNLFFENKIAPVWASTRVAAATLGISPNALPWAAPRVPTRTPSDFQAKREKSPAAS